MNALYPAIARRAGHRCEYCRAPEAVFNFPFEVEHIVPTSRRGTDDDSNLALACRACNLHKRDHVTGEDESTKAIVRLFDPRQDHWETHFDLNPRVGTISGLTAVGRATVARLEMNSPSQLFARLHWLRLGLLT